MGEPRRRIAAARRPWAALACLLLTACSGPDGGSGEEAVVAAEPPPPRGPRRPAVLGAADRRDLEAVPLQGLLDPDPRVRRTTVLALARLHDADAAPRLRQALADPAGEVRDAASLGLGALEEEAPADAARWVLGAIVSEPDAGRRGRWLRDLARIAPDDLVPVFGTALSSAEAPVRAGACHGLYELLRRDRPARRLLPRAAGLVAPDQPPEVRLACAHALARAPRLEGPGLQAALELALADADPEVRRFAYRAYGRLGEADASRLLAGTEDPDWRVAVQAARSFGPVAARSARGVGLGAVLLERRFADAVADREVRSGPPLHVLLATIDAVLPAARSGPIYELATELIDQVVYARQGHPGDRGRLHCALAGLADAGRSWPARLAGCGFGEVADVERRVGIAHLLGAVRGAEDPRFGRLRQLLRDPAPRVRQAAFRALGDLPHPEAAGALVEGLSAEQDPGAIAAACDAVAGRPTTEPLSPELPRVLAPLLGRLDCVRDVEPLASCLAILERVGGAALAEVMTRAALCPHPVVHRRARRLLARWDVPVPEEPPSPPPHLADAAAIAALPDTPRVTVDTERGRFVLRLDPERAPTTVLRFLELVDEGFYDGLRFHRVVPAFVVQGGDPRGDGYGGPGWTQRCEDHRLPYRRGTIGMALAGRDTGGSQFFLTYGAEPHLETRYTAFGRLERGEEVLDALQAGDRITRVRRAGAAPDAPPPTAP